MFSNWVSVAIWNREFQRRIQKPVQHLRWNFSRSRLTSVYYFCILNTSLSLDVNEACFDKELISLICMKYQQKNRSIPERYKCGKHGAMNKNVGVFVLPRIRSRGILWIIEYEIRRCECSHSESLKLPVK